MELDDKENRTENFDEEQDLRAESRELSRQRSGLFPSFLLLSPPLRSESNPHGRKDRRILSFLRIPYVYDK
jgi:hypothetical protein